MESNRSPVGKVCQVTAVILFILDVILAFKLAGAISDSFFYRSGDGGAVIFSFLAVVAIGFVPCLLIFAVGSILDYLASIDGTLDDLRRDTLKLQSSGAPASAPSKSASSKSSYRNPNVPAPNHPPITPVRTSFLKDTPQPKPEPKPAPKPAESTWTCANCGCANRSGDLFCAQCGTKH